MRVRPQTAQQLWLRACTTPAQRPTTRLVCLPHAGGTAQAYRSWSAWVPGDIGVFAVQYPGRQDRFGEPLIDDLQRMVAAVAAAVVPFVGEGLAIFGHSMGAMIAYELTVELERRHGPVVDLLVVSGAPAPHRKVSKGVHTLADADLIADVLRLNPSSAALLTDPALADLLIPMIRADYRLTETYRCAAPRPVAAPLLAVGGTADPDVGHDDLAGWSAVAASRFEVVMFPGDHFYLAENQSALVNSITGRLPRRSPVRRRPRRHRDRHITRPAPPGPGVPATGRSLE